MTELKRPERYVQFESIKPKLKEITEFYTRKVKDYQYRLKQLDEYADALENEISVLKETPKVEVLLDDMAKPLVVVPQCVADWIKATIAKGFKPLMNSSKFGELGFTEEKLAEILHWINEHQEEYMRAWLDGYMVEKEQLYEVEFYVDEEDDRYLLMKTGKTISFEYESQNEGHYQQQFTEAEIKAIDERYWVFAFPV